MEMEEYHEDKKIQKEELEKLQKEILEEAKKIVKDYSLDSGDLSPHDTLELESILKRFIETNRAIKFNNLSF